MRAVILIISLLVARPAAAQADLGILQGEAVGWLQSYLRVNTVNPPGNAIIQGSDRDLAAATRCVDCRRDCIDNAAQQGCAADGGGCDRSPPRLKSGRYAPDGYAGAGIR